MPPKPPAPKPHVEHHRDGTVWARGQTLDGVPTGYWEWYRKDGTRLRSGHFDGGRQVGQWTTYDREGRIYKVTTLKPAPAPAVRRLVKARIAENTARAAAPRGGRAIDDKTRRGGTSRAEERRHAGARRVTARTRKAAAG